MYTYFNEERESLAAYYILPLLNLSFKTFGSYYKAAKINRDLDCIRLELTPGCTEKFWEHWCYQVDYDRGNTTFAEFRIPLGFKNDLKIFASGKYSKISTRSKKLIYKHSGLHYNKQIDNLVVTDMKLLALTQSQILKDWLIDNYRLKIGKKAELIIIKNKENIYYD